MKKEGFHIIDYVGVVVSNVTASTGKTGGGG